MFRELPSRWARGIARFLARDEEGQAIFLVVGFFLLLAGLLFLIVNTGDQLNTKVEMQNAADAATATGSAWYARGLNAISMSNATEAQIMSFIVVLDTLEEVIPHAVQTIDDLVANLGQTPAGRDMPIYEPIAWLTVGEARAEQDIVHKLADIVQGIPLEEYFSYDDGVLWQACKLLDAFAEEMAEITPLLCQEQTILVAQDNNAEFGALSPLWPVLPVRDGVFEDFRNPMVSAQMPPPLNSRIGGFTQLFGYGTGPYSHFRDPFINCKPMGLFDLSRLSPMFRIVSSMKFEMLFGSEDDMLCLGKWEMDYDKAVEIARLEAEARSAGLEPEVTILRTWWEHVGFDSREEFPTSQFYQSIDQRSPKNPQPSLQSNDGWRAAPANHTRSTTAMEGADSRHAIFYRSTERRTVNYPALGIIPPHPPYNEDGTERPYKESDYKIYYHTSMRRFNGVELEVDTQLSRAYLPPAGTVPPLAPVLLDRAIGDNMTAHIADHFTFMGFAYTGGGVSEWSARFSNPNPNPKTVCYAQARVFNPITWDLFTQSWQVKLVRVNRWQSVLADIQGGMPADGNALGDLFSQDMLKPIEKILQNYSQDFVEEVTH